MPTTALPQFPPKSSIPRNLSQTQAVLLKGGMPAALMAVASFVDAQDPVQAIRGQVSLM